VRSTVSDPGTIPSPILWSRNSSTGLPGVAIARFQGRSDPQEYPVDFWEWENTEFGHTEVAHQRRSGPVEERQRFSINSRKMAELDKIDSPLARLHF